MIQKQNELINELTEKTDKCYEFICSARQEQDLQRDREMWKTQGRRERSRLFVEIVK
jgi:hypothetical protein